MNTPPRQTQSTGAGQPIPAVFQTPPRPERLEFVEPPPVVRYSKKRRANPVIETDPSIRHLGTMFNNIALEQ